MHILTNSLTVHLPIIHTNKCAPDLAVSILIFGNFARFLKLVLLLKKVCTLEEGRQLDVGGRCVPGVEQTLWGRERVPVGVPRRYPPVHFLTHQLGSFPFLYWYLPSITLYYINRQCWVIKVKPVYFVFMYLKYFRWKGGKGHLLPELANLSRWAL